ncbi:RNA polymerase sigma factor [candidate division WOR-3 bacterium]|nr:RNA polymerase sigma factor [candidate division WOR-3 bacterium]
MTDRSSLLMGKDVSRDELADLVRRGKEDDEAALERLSIYVYSHVYAFMYYRVAQPEDTDDLTSEVVLKVIKGLKQQRGNFNAWMYRIARNRLIDFYRRRAMRSEISLNDIPRKELTKSEDFSKQIMTREKLRQGMEQLTEDQRQVIILKFIEGYANNEVAEILGRSVGAVKVLQFRALRALREYFSGRGHAEKN